MTSTQTATQEQVKEILKGKWRERVDICIPNKHIGTQYRGIRDESHKWFFESDDYIEYAYVFTSNFHKEGDTLKFLYWTERWIDDTIETGHYEKRLEVFGLFTVTSVEVVQVDGVWYFEYGLERVEE